MLYIAPFRLTSTRAVVPFAEAVHFGARPRGDADLRIEALDMVVGGLGRDIELAAASLAVSPAAIRRKTSISRAVGPASLAPIARRAG
jgi:hypothetical protein